MKPNLRLPALAVAGILSAIGFTAHCAPGRMRITFSGYAGDETLRNFPALITFANLRDSMFAEFPFTATTAYDLRFYDESGKTLDYEIDSFKPNSKLNAWVKIPELKPDGKTYITATWGDPAKTGQLPCTTNGAVWVNNYLLVQHYEESGNTVSDSAPLKRNGKIITPPPADAYAEGRIGLAANLSANNRNNGIVLDKPLPLGNEWTIGVWFKNLLPADEYRTLARGNSHHHVLIEKGSHRIGAWIARFYPTSNSAEITPDTPPRWRHLTAVGKESSTTFFLDGKFIGTVNSRTVDDIIGIGCTQVPPNHQKFANYLDEFRIAGRARSADWIRAEYDNQKPDSAFLSFRRITSQHTETLNFPPPEKSPLYRYRFLGFLVFPLIAVSWFFLSKKDK